MESKAIEFRAIVRHLWLPPDRSFGRGLLSRPWTGAHPLAYGARAIQGLHFSSQNKTNTKSLHTTVVGPSRQRVELQIRTEHMHQIAEYGIAAHTDYKDGNGVDFANSAAYSSLRKTISQLAEADNPEEFLEHTKLELFLDQVFCFTPKGQIIALPKGATPIDFAYAVHTDIGNSTIGCKLNGKVMPVVTQLHNGDEVEIIRSKSQSPPAAWQSVVVTGKARSCIRRASRNAAHRQFSANRFKNA